MDRGESIDELLAAARAQYVAALPDKVSAIEELMRAGAWLELRRAAHKLRGSAATYDYPSLGQAMAAIEEALLESGEAPDPAVRGHVSDHLGQARAAVERLLGEAR